MGEFIIVEELELARVLSGNHKPTSEGWKTELVWQREDIGTSVGMTSMENLTGVTRMVAKWFTFYITAALKYLCTPKAKFRWTSQLGSDLPTLNRRYLALGHTTSGS